MSKELKITSNDTDTNDYKQLFHTLRENINTSKSKFRSSLGELKDMIDTREKELELLKEKAIRLKGAIEACDVFLKEPLPSNNKR